MNAKGKNLSLAEAVTHFLVTLPPGAREESQQELNKFIRWFGRERLIGELTIREVADYAERIGTSNANPARKLEPVRAFLSYAKKEGLTETNLAVHLRVRKGSPKKGTDRPSQKTIGLTPDGYRELESELAALKRERPRIAEELRKAAADKDFAENAPLDAAREYQGMVEARIRELEQTLKSAVVISEESKVSNKAGLGSRLTLRDLETGEELHFTIVNPSEANPSRGRISISSPTGRALAGHEEGEVIKVTTPAGILRYRIESIEH